MAQQGVQLDRKTFSCSICLDQLKDPVTIPCGHNYCMSCIKTHWDGEDETQTYSCPQCKKTFTPRPLLVKNAMLGELLEERKKMHENEQRIQNREKDVKLLQQEVKAINGSAAKAVEHSEKTFAELIRLIQKTSSDVDQKIRNQQETEVSRVKDLQKKLEQEVAELKKKDSELSEATRSSSINIRPLKYFEDVIAPVSEAREKLQDVLRKTWTNISQIVTQVDVLLSQPEPKTREDFLKYSRDIILDINTAHVELTLSEGNKKAGWFSQTHDYPDHTDRFFDCPQALSKESLTGLCYWEVELEGEGIFIAVAYKNISRGNRFQENQFGSNDKSWALYITTCHTVKHNNVETVVPGPYSNRIGVYLDHSAGILSFYSISETKTMTLLHRVQTTFTQPLYAGIGINWYPCGAAEFIELK